MLGRLRNPIWSVRKLGPGSSGAFFVGRPPAILKDNPEAGRDDGEDAMTDEAGGEWMTYAEAAARLGIKAESVKRRARSRKWPRRVGNDGAARVLVPRERLDGAGEDGPEAGRPAVPPPPTPDAATLERAIRAEARADAAESLLSEVRADRDHWRQMAERLSHPESVVRRFGLFDRILRRGR